MRTIILCNQKGGVGKTTAALGIAGALQASKHKVLFVDLDSQANSTYVYNIENIECTVTDILRKYDKYDVHEAIYHTEKGDIIPSDKELAALETELLTSANGIWRLKKHLAKVQDEYEFCIIDSPPNLGALSMSGLIAATEYIIPVIGTQFAIDGLSKMFETINDVLEVHPDLKYDGILMTEYDMRKNDDKEVWQQLKNNKDLKAFSIPIRTCSKVSQAQGKAMSLQHPKYAKTEAAEDYRTIAKEIVRKR